MARRNFLSILHYLFSNLRVEGLNFKLRLFAATLCVLLSIGLNIATPLLFKNLVDAFALHSKGVISPHLLLMLLAYGLSWSFSKIFVHCGELIMQGVVGRAVRLFSSKVFNHLICLSAEFHLNRSTGAVSEAIFRAQEGLVDIFWGLAFTIIPLSIEIIFSTVIIGMVFGAFFSTLFLAIFVAFISFTWFCMLWMGEARQRLNIIKMRTGAKIVDSLLNYETVKVFSNTDHEIQRADKLFCSAEQSYREYFWRVDVGHSIQGLIIGSGLILLTFFSGKAVLLGQLTIGEFTLVNSYLMQFIMPLHYLGKVMKDLRKGSDDIANALDILGIESQIKDSPGAVALQVKKPRIEFKDVSFGYEGDRNILSKVSFVVEPGQTVALVGMTGSGKSTIARLLYRFYDINQGQVLIDGIDLRNVQQESLQKLIGIVPQDTVLFNDTLQYNITYGDFAATEEQIEDAIKRAHLRKIIDAMPNGLKTMVGERGLKLSGGEKQRVAIARVILKQPAIYVFDEATSALDTRTEKQIQQNLREISENCTTLIIAHRLSTVVHADKIIVLENGQIIEMGNHKELLAMDGVYAKMYSHQT